MSFSNSDKVLFCSIYTSLCICAFWPPLPAFVKMVFTPKCYVKVPAFLQPATQKVELQGAAVRALRIPRTETGQGGVDCADRVPDFAAHQLLGGAFRFCLPQLYGVQVETRFGHRCRSGGYAGVIALQLLKILAQPRPHSFLTPWNYILHTIRVLGG